MNPYESSGPGIPQVPVQAQLPLPNSTEVLVLGILSIPICCCGGIFGLAAGIIAIVLGGKALKLYKENPGVYTKSSYDNANAGYICGIIGTALSALSVIYYLIYLVVVVIYGGMLTSMFSNGTW